MNHQIADPMATTVEWQKLGRPLVVLPIGSLEQHGTHLPLATDSVQADYFGRFLAEQLGAALLPVLPIAQSYEHTGYRGTVSLRPETFMAVIRDIADELEQQNFTRLIILNGHGGNFALPTLVRDLNRADRKLKLLLVNYWEYDRSDAGRELMRGDVHSAAWETSLMLALAPDRVRPIPAREPEIAEPAAVQFDLNHFGLGTLRPQGPWGDPRRATAAAGQAIRKSIEDTMPTAVRERLTWLERHPQYGGLGPVVTRVMTPEDIPATLNLCRTAGWNQLAADLEMFLHCSPDGCFVAQHNGRLVGTTATINYGNRVSWIAMVLVEAGMRNRGIGTQLMQAALDGPLAACESVKLDATPAGKRVYDKLGFKDEFNIRRLMITKAPTPPAAREHLEIREMTAADLPAVEALDATVFGCARHNLFAGLLAMAPEYAWVALDASGRLLGFCNGRHGANCEYLGAITAGDLAIAKALAQRVFPRMAGRPILIDVPVAQSDFTAWLNGLGFAEQRFLMRMYRNSNRYLGNPKNVYALAGPEFG